MIKYLGSKRTLIPAITKVTQILAPETVLDLFSGTTRVGQALKKQGCRTTVNDIASYSKIFGDCYIATDGSQIDRQELQQEINYLSSLEGEAGYFTEVFCQQSRFFQPKNGRKIDRIRQLLTEQYQDSWLYPILLTALIEAADRVDSTTGVQMAYLKSWSERSYQDLQLRIPELIDGAGSSTQHDATSFLDRSSSYDLVYIDPPYNQHRYFTNYHIWETLVRWDQPEHYGVACKRIDSRSEENKSVFNRKKLMPKAFQRTITDAPGKAVLVSYNNESWVSIAEIESWVKDRFEACLILDFDYKRYVGAQIGIFNPHGKPVGEVSHLRNREFLILGASQSQVEAVASLWKR